ncbi:MAG TPA: 50S ribosomal protein L21 [Patescibacteria group bacterium]|nr:50S ribosomal protein L21 [Patescibacteria group bacterium]
MKKAVIQTGGKQYLVSEGDEINVELIKSEKKSILFDALLIIEDKVTEIGKPTLEKKVTADIINSEVQGEKVTSVRYKAKKRVRKVKGHRQKRTLLKVKKIA